MDDTRRFKLLGSSSLSSLHLKESSLISRQPCSAPCVVAGNGKETGEKTCSCSAGALRFSAHRGIDPAEVSAVGLSLSATLPWSKTQGARLHSQTRTLNRDSLHPCCFLIHNTWLPAKLGLVERNNASQARPPATQSHDKP